jgi:hypothetical protein
MVFGADIGQRKLPEILKPDMTIQAIAVIKQNTEIHASLAYPDSNLVSETKGA